jgi:pyridoxamine 5'-phosphate oxidase
MSDLIPPSPRYGDAPDIAEDEGLFAEQEPFALFAAWFKEAKAKEPNDPNAMALATADESGMPDVRMVLLKEVDPRGFVFYTNLESAKGRQLAANPQAALCFHWKSLGRQVRMKGAVGPVSAEEADAYFATRDRGAQIGAWASEQSRPMEGRFALEKRAAEFGMKFGLAQPPRPPHWSGFRLNPERIEFWRNRPLRLHDRLVFTRNGAGWGKSRLFP